MRSDSVRQRRFPEKRNVNLTQIQVNQRVDTSFPYHTLVKKKKTNRKRIYQLIFFSLAAKRNWLKHVWACPINPSNHLQPPDKPTEPPRNDRCATSNSWPGEFAITSKKNIYIYTIIIIKGMPPLLKHYYEPTTSTVSRYFGHHWPAYSSTFLDFCYCYWHF